VFVGPSWLSAEQELVNRSTYDEVYPYDSATLTGTTVITTSARRSTIGLGAQMHVTVLGPVAVGFEVRHAKADLDFSIRDDRSARVQVGGTQALVSALLAF
jgi:hypothetical protein